MPMGITEAAVLADTWIESVATTPFANADWFKPNRMQFRVPAVVPGAHISCFPALVALAPALALMLDTSAAG